MSGPIFHESIDLAAIDLSWVKELSVLEVTFHEPETWYFNFGNKMGISAECFWRIASKQRVEISSADHGQFYGYKTPIDAASKGTNFLKQHLIKKIEIKPVTSDLMVHFDGDLYLQIIPDSIGYESWHIFSPAGRAYGVNGAGLFTYLDP